MIWCFSTDNKAQAISHSVAYRQKLTGCLSSVHATVSPFSWDITGKLKKDHAQPAVNAAIRGRVRTCLEGAEGGGDENVRCDRRLYHSQQKDRSTRVKPCPVRRRGRSRPPWKHAKRSAYPLFSSDKGRVHGAGTSWV